MTKESSPMSSPASISSVFGVESLGSDAQSVCSLGVDNAPEPHFIPENAEGVKAFTHGDGDFELCVNGMLFQTHKYLLKRFSGLRSMIEQKATDYQDKPLTLEREHGLEDFRNTLKVLYTSPIESSLEFDTGILVSALRVATAYDYPALQTFAINKLEEAHLSAIDRIRIAREFGFASWEEPAYVELCEREEPITEEEANVLGVSTFVQVATIREKEQRRKCEKRGERQNKGVGEADRGGEVAGKRRLGSDELATALQAMASGKVKVTASKAAAAEEAKLEGGSGDTVQVGGVKIDDAVKKSSQGPNPCFIGFSPANATSSCISTSGAIQTTIPGCQCRSPADTRIYNHYGTQIGRGALCQCTISPCAAKALEQLQVHQVAQASSIMELESAVEEIRSGWEPAQSITDAGRSSSTGLTEVTSVQAEVREWLGACNGQSS